MNDISGVPRNSKVYNGTTRKYGITVNGVDYIVKYPKSDDLSVYCEYLASNFINKLGVLCHEVSLAICDGVVVDLIKDFTSVSGMELHAFKDTKQSSEDTDLSGKVYTYDDVLYLIDKHLKMSDSDKLEAKKHFWDMFICDAIVGNRDRHWGNWGYFKSREGYLPAPLYDNGASLYPGVAKVIYEYVNPVMRTKFLYDRVYTVPASLFMIKKPDRNYRSNYAEMFKDLRVNKIFAERVAWFKKNVSYKYVFNSMRDLCGGIFIPDSYRRFYTEIVTMRYMCIVLRMDFEKAYGIVEAMLV